MGAGLTRPLAAAAAVAGALIMAGSLLDWSGVEYSSTLDRWVAFASGGGVLIAAAAALREPRVLVACLVSGTLGLNMAIVNIRDIAGHEYEYVRYPEAAVGVGLYAVLAGSVLALAVGVMSLPALRPRRAAR